MSDKVAGVTGFGAAKQSEIKDIFDSIDAKSYGLTKSEGRLVDNLVGKRTVVLRPDGDDENAFVKALAARPEHVGKVIPDVLDRVRSRRSMALVKKILGGLSDAQLDSLPVRARAAMGGEILATLVQHPKCGPDMMSLLELGRSRHADAPGSKGALGNAGIDAGHKLVDAVTAREARRAKIEDGTVFGMLRRWYGQDDTLVAIMGVERAGEIFAGRARDYLEKHGDVSASTLRDSLADVEQQIAHADAMAQEQGAKSVSGGRPAPSRPAPEAPKPSRKR